MDPGLGEQIDTLSLGLSVHSTCYCTPSSFHASGYNVFLFISEVLG